MDESQGKKSLWFSKRWTLSKSTSTSSRPPKCSKSSTDPNDNNHHFTTHHCPTASTWKKYFQRPQSPKTTKTKSRTWNKSVTSSTHQPLHMTLAPKYRLYKTPKASMFDWSTASTRSASPNNQAASNYKSPARNMSAVYTNRRHYLHPIEAQTPISSTASQSTCLTRKNSSNNNPNFKQIESTTKTSRRNSRLRL